jgi:hypothetical protein
MSVAELGGASAKLLVLARKLALDEYRASHRMAF